MLCREEAIQIWNKRQEFEAAGVRLVCVLHEWIDREVEAFAPAYWGEALLLRWAWHEDLPASHWEHHSASTPLRAHPRCPDVSPASRCSRSATPSPLPGGELYYDADKAFYAAVHGGKPARASLLQLLSPAVWRAGKRAKASGLVQDSNLKGDGLTLGGEAAARARG